MMVSGHFGGMAG